MSRTYTWAWSSRHSAEELDAGSGAARRNPPGPVISLSGTIFIRFNIQRFAGTVAEVRHVSVRKRGAVVVPDDERDVEQVGVG